ncbi:SCO2322 family protein [Nonomuraea sp. M3C6]|uniref:SCO2322 family protein n=1 Tax=Nonomuraea marmarensis TaxID=3351344 RepID=A0ABW7A2X8_9ACTN
MLRAYRVAAGVALGAAAFLSLPFSALASPSIDPNDPVPGAADPNATRVWSVWQSDGTAWLAATAKDAPPDGSVIGWRFSVALDGARAPAAESPGGDQPSFQAVCGKDAAASGHKRVVVAVDFGDGDADAYPGDRPPAQGAVKCVAGAEDATTAQLLASAARVRVNAQGDVVTVDDYPAREKGGTDLGAATAPAADQGGGPPIALIAGGAGALALLAGGAVVATRRRAKSPAR